MRWQPPEGLQRTARLNIASKRLNDWHVQQQPNATAGSYREDGLYRAPKAVTKWSLERAIQGAPRVPWSASGYARGLRGWILDHVTSIHAVEFSAFHPSRIRWIGVMDCWISMERVHYVIDWKTTGKSIHKSNESQLVNYRAQLGAYSLDAQLPNRHSSPGWSDRRCPPIRSPHRRDAGPRRIEETGRCVPGALCTLFHGTSYITPLKSPRSPLEGLLGTLESV